MIVPEIPALLVGHFTTLLPSGGGVQLCNREYAEALAKAGFRLREIPYHFDDRIHQRVWRRFIATPPRIYAKSEIIAKIQQAILLDNVRHIFYSLSIPREICQQITIEHPDVVQIFLSHGVEGIDICIAQVLARQLGNGERFRAIAERRLGKAFLEAAEERRWMDAVLTLSPFEADMEKWLGTRKCSWIPRTIMENPLASRPTDGRVGCVATLDHPPNIHGLVQLFEKLKTRVPENFRFRLVGHPPRPTQNLLLNYSFVDYLGPLTDAALREEAATWCCFVHPMFVYAKGCSTKLGVALGWELPIATTQFGARGYIWDPKIIPLAESPENLADAVISQCIATDFELRRRSTKEIKKITPKKEAVARQIREFLLE